MKVLEVIPAKRWKNAITGQTASIYGSLPYVSDEHKAHWTIEVYGYTWRLDNGTIGLGRPAAKTKEEAIEVMNKFNNLR